VGEAGRAPDTTPLTMARPASGDSSSETPETDEPVTGIMAPPPKNGDDTSGVSTEEEKPEGTSPGQMVRQAVAATNNWFTGRKQNASPDAPQESGASAAATPVTPAPATSAAKATSPSPATPRPAAAANQPRPATPAPATPSPAATAPANTAPASPTPAVAHEPPAATRPTVTPAPTTSASPAAEPARANSARPAPTTPAMPGRPAAAQASGPATAATPAANGAAGRPASAFNSFRGGAGGGFATRGPAATGPVETSPWSAAKPPKKKQRRNKRQAHLTVARVEPWSVMKFSFVVSVIAFIVLFVAVAILYGVLSGLGVFTSLQHLVSTVTSSKSSGGTDINSWFSASRILGYTGLLGALNIVLITAMATIGAVIYNLIAGVFGGVEITLRETD
jgi:hypothetical protein